MTPEPSVPSPHNGLKPAESSGGHAAMTRRRLIRLGWPAGLIMVLGGQLLWLLKVFLTPRESGGSGEPITAGPIGKFPVGSVTHFWKQRFLLVRRPTGFLALSQECTHQQCNVHFIPERREIVCPCHGARFNLNGVVLAGTAPRPLDRFATAVQDGQVFVDTSQHIGAAG